MTDQNVDLRVRAVIEGKKDLQAVAKSIDAISEAIDKQSAAAKRGERVFDELKGSEAALAQENQNLSRTLRDLDAFQTYADKIDKAEKAVARTTTAHAKFAQKLREQGSATQEQSERLAALAKAEKNAGDKLAARIAEQAALNASLQAAGLVASDYAASQEKIVATQLRQVDVQAKLNRELQQYSSNVSAGRAAEKSANDARAKELADALQAEKVLVAEQTFQKKLVDAANLVKATDYVRFWTEALDKADAVERESAKSAADTANARAAAIKKLTAAFKERAQAQAQYEARKGESASNSRTDDEERASIQRAQQLLALKKDIEERSAAAAAASNRNSEVAGNARADSEERARIARAQQLLALRKDIEERSAQAVVDTGLAKLADDAEKSARSFTTLAKASTNLKPQVVSLKDAIGAILNPGASLRSTLGGVEQDVASLTAAIAKIKGPVTDYRTTLAALEGAQKAIGKQSGLVDDFTRQTSALRLARTEFANARSQVTQYAAAVRQGGSDTQANTNALAAAQARLRTASAAMRDQVTATRESRDALRAAGIASNDLAGAQSRLTNAASSTVAATKAVTTAVEQYGVAVDKVGKKKVNLWDGDGDGGRTTLSLIQRIRGEVLSLAASYVGLYGAIATAKGALDAFNTREGAKNQLSIGVGSSKSAIDAEYNYVKGQADRIGVEFERAIKGYAKFSAAAALAGRGRQEIRYIFEAFTEVSRVANLSADDLDGVFKALEQVFSKGKIQAEELRGQLGDRLFGAFQIAAKALKDQFPDLDKAMKDGQVTSEQLVKIAEEYRRIVAEELPAATQSLAAQQMRMNNAVYDFKLAVADNGWADAYKQALVVLIDFMQSTDGQNAAKAFAQSLVAIANGFVWLLKNIDSVKFALEALLSLFVAKQIVGFIGYAEKAAAALALIAPQAGAAAGGVAALSAKWPLLTTAIKTSLGVITAAFAGWEIGTWAYQKFTIVRQAGTWMVTGLDEAWVLIKGGWSMLWAALPSIANNAFIAVLNSVTLGVRKMLGIFAVLTSAVGLDKISSTLLAAADGLTIGYADVGNAISAERAKMDGELAKIRQIRKEMLADNLKGGKTKGAVVDPVTGKSVASPTAKPLGSNSPNKPTGDTEAALKKRESLIDEITRALETLDAKIDRSQTESLASQLEAIDLQYAALSRKIASVGGETGKQFMAHVAKSIAELREQTTNKFNDGLLKDREALLSKVEGAEAAAGRKDKASLDERLAAIRTSYESTYREITNFRLKLFANSRDTTEVDEAKARLDAGVLELQNLERIKFAKEELTRKEARLTELVKLRDSQIAVVNATKEAGNLSDIDAATQINAINAAALPGINAAAEATRLWAVENAKVFSTPEDQAIFLAALEQVRIKAAQVKTEFSAIEQAGLKGAVDGINLGLNAMIDNLQQVFNGQMNMAQGFQGVMQAFGQFAADFLRKIATMIIQQAIFNAMKNSGNPILMAVGAAGSAAVKHDGGVIGSFSGSQRTRNVDTSWFANAPRYHSGGVPGLAPDEYATILQKGEEVLAADSPRNVMNGGGGATAGKPADTSGMRVVLVDDRSKVHEAMASSDGERVIVQAIRRNIPSIKQMIRS